MDRTMAEHTIGGTRMTHKSEGLQYLFVPMFWLLVVVS